ncbi:MAG: DUF952 domain-containing protein [Chloroflexaceae bacterium]
MIYHITRNAAWTAARAAGSYAADSLATEGFIHFSTRDQVLRVANTLFHGQTGLVLLVVDPARLSAPLRYEEAHPGEYFPHLYGPLNLDAVVAMYPFSPQPDGSFHWPPGAPGTGVWGN